MILLPITEQYSVSVPAVLHHIHSLLDVVWSLVEDYLLYIQNSKNFIHPHALVAFL